MAIRRASAADFDAMWRIFEAVIAPGDAYVFGPDTSREDAREYWFGPGVMAYVHEDATGRIGGMCKLVGNQRDRGAHVANASFMVEPSARGQGIGKQLAERCIEEARKAGFLAMQFNFVVSTNVAAVRLWTHMGFHIAGTLPGAFRHERLGLVDAYVMFRALDDEPGPA